MKVKVFTKLTKQLTRDSRGQHLVEREQEGAWELSYEGEARRNEKGDVVTFDVPLSRGRTKTIKVDRPRFSEDVLYKTTANSLIRVEIIEED